MKASKHLRPDELRERAFRALVRARQWTEKAEGLYRLADRRERAQAEKSEAAAAWPWPCRCGAIYATKEELQDHRDSGKCPSSGTTRASSSGGGAQ